MTRKINLSSKLSERQGFPQTTNTRRSSSKSKGCNGESGNNDGTDRIQNGMLNNDNSFFSKNVIGNSGQSQKGQSSESIESLLSNDSVRENLKGLLGQLLIENGYNGSGGEDLNSFDFDIFFQKLIQKNMGLVNASDKRRDLNDAIEYGSGSDDTKPSTDENFVKSRNGNNNYEKDYEN